MLKEHEINTKYFTHIQLHPQISIFYSVSTIYAACMKKLPNLCTLFMVDPKYKMNEFIKMILVSITLLTNYIEFITANPKVLHMAEFDFVLATPKDQ